MADRRSKASLRRAIVGVALVAVGAAACSSTSPSTSTTASTSQRAVGQLGKPVDVYAHTHAGDLSPAARGIPARVYVPNGTDGTVDVIDPTTFTIIDHFTVGKYPQHVVPSWDLKTLYVNNNAGYSLTPIDARSGKPGPAIPVPDPYNLYFSIDGSKAFVMAETFARIDVRDPLSWALIASIPIPHRGVNHADFNADGTTMFASTEFAGWLERIDLATMKVSGELQLGGQPIDVKLAPDGTVLYVANQTRAGVSVVDIATFKEVAFIPTGLGAHGLYPSRDGTKLYVTNRGAGSVSVIDFATRRVVATWHVGGSPDMGGVSGDGSQFWVTSRYHHSVLVIDTASGALIHEIHVGRGPHGLAYFPQPGRFSLGHTGVYR
jgi:YVTN family beta-propeller protein